MTEKSPIDLLTEIHNMLSDQNHRISLLEKNIALLHDKANGKLFPEMRLIKPGQEVPIIKAKPAQSVMDELAAQQKIVGIPQPKLDIALVHGRIYGPDKKPILDVSVVIKNQKHNVVKQLKTNKEGYWEAELGVGKYALTYSKAAMSSMYRFVEVKEGQFEVEIL